MPNIRDIKDVTATQSSNDCNILVEKVVDNVSSLYKLPASNFATSSGGGVDLSIALDATDSNGAARVTSSLSYDELVSKITGDSSASPAVPPEPLIITAALDTGGATPLAIPMWYNASELVYMYSAVPMDGIPAGIIILCGFYDSYKLMDFGSNYEPAIYILSIHESESTPGEMEVISFAM